MNIVLWILRVLPAVAFLAHGWLFLSPQPEIAAQLSPARRRRAGSLLECPGIPPCEGKSLLRGAVS